MAELTAVRDEDGSWRFDAVTAAASIPVKPPSAWFEDPRLSEPTAITVTADGRIYGHACSWQVRHIGLPGHRTAPKSTTGYREYLRSQVEADDGSMIATGPLTLGGGHAGLDGDITAAIEHYDDVSSCVGDIAVGEDAHGLWMAGALRPGTTPEQVRQLRGSAVSGDWRAIHDGKLALCAIHAVNVPGFNVPRANLAASGAPTALVAAGVVTRDAPAAPAPKQQSPDLTTCRTPEEVAAVASQHQNTEHNDETTEDEAVTAGGPPFGDDSDGGSGSGGYDPGDTVMLAGSELPFQVTGETDNGDVVIEATVPADQLEAADEAMAAAAYARFDERQQDRVRDAQAARMAASQRETSEQLAAVTAALSSVTAKLEGLEADKRAETARELLASAGIE